MVLTMEIMTHMINMTHSRRKNRPRVFQGLGLDLWGATRGKFHVREKDFFRHCDAMDYPLVMSK